MTGVALEPGYVPLFRSGALARRADEARHLLESCMLCPRACATNRLADEVGWCGAGSQARVASWAVHRWEEPPISGWAGSGTIFFSGCTARCVFCQNYPISQLGVGGEVDADHLAGMMMELQGKGVHNINLVTPTHYVPQILEALCLAAANGLRVPMVYNTSGYETVDTLRMLDGVVDIYLPDAKYADDGAAARLSGYSSYVAANRAALREMFRQVGDDLVLDEMGIACRGMIVRHLVLPGDMAKTGEVMCWLAANLSPGVWISLMDQYFPAHRAVGDPHLGRKITVREYQDAVAAFHQAGLLNGWLQEHDACQ